MVTGSTPETMSLAVAPGSTKGDPAAVFSGDAPINVTTGLVGSRTITVRVAVPALPACSVALEGTGEEPGTNGWMLLLAVTATGPATASTAVAPASLYAAPASIVAGAG